MSRFRPYHIMFRPRRSQGAWAIWCEQSGRQARSRAIQRLAIVWLARYCFAVQDYGSDEVYAYHAPWGSTRKGSVLTMGVMSILPPAEQALRGHETLQNNKGQICRPKTN
jgi:hypothetical protein